MRDSGIQGFRDWRIRDSSDEGFKDERFRISDE